MSDSEIKLFLLQTEFLFQKLRDYLTTVDQALNSEENRAWQYLDVSLRESFWWEIKKFDFEYFWPLAKHYSFITLLHLILEERLRQLCKIVQANDEQMSQHPVGNKVKDYLDFLKKAVDYETRQSEVSRWQDITDIELIRNCIVHAFGRIERVPPKSKERLQLLVNTDGNLSIVTRDPESPQLVPSYDYCRNAVTLAIGFFRELCDLFCLVSVSPPKS